MIIGWGILPQVTALLNGLKNTSSGRYLWYAQRKTQHAKNPKSTIEQKTAVESSPDNATLVSLKIKLFIYHYSSSLPYHRIGDLHIRKILGHLDFMLWEKEVVSFFSVKDHKEKIH